MTLAKAMASLRRPLQLARPRIIKLASLTAIGALALFPGQAAAQKALNANGPTQNLASHHTAVTMPRSPSPVALVEQFHAAVLEVSKNTEELGYQGRRHELEKAVRASFNTDAMARISVGEHWNNMGPTERRRLSQSYVKVLSSLMADKFDFYYGQDFKTVAQRPINRNLRYVDSRLVLPRGRTFPLTYVAGYIDQHWGLIDVVTPGGTSLLRVRHGEYHSVIKRRGVEGFLAALDEMVDGFDDR